MATTVQQSSLERVSIKLAQEKSKNMLTKREQYAKAALQGALSRNLSAEESAAWAVAAADALILKLEQTKDKP